ncbi:sodium/proline symporter [Kytococcus aerolatus]|uniref:Sodium/proline symporter n=1 Tax=Kytococcus aerolatus TaxID=592308 RepID=A0A212U628_9MICO|nr:sodium/proline symporter PutP [Kytococcus aerolatus]SNC73544.1 sodium/proline symporter [Kytococcus aerolatus]
MSAHTWQLVAIVIYFVAMIAIGVWSMGRTKNKGDYMLGGRGLGPVASALSAGASDMSGWLLMGLPGALYAAGLVELWIAIGLTAGAWLNWKFVAPRLRTYTEVAGDAITVPSFYSNRTHDSRGLVRIVAGIIILVFFTFYVSSGMVAGGHFFEASFGTSYLTGMLIVFGVVMLYTLIGGFLAVSYTDVVQGLTMLVALVLVPIAGILHLGGPGATVDAIRAVDPDALQLTGGALTTMGLVSSLAWGLGYFGQPHIITRFMALRSSQQAAQARRIGIGWMALACLGAAATALIGVGVYQRNEAELANPETVFLDLGMLLFHPFVAGFMLAAILAAIMSTISSQLIVSSSALVEDIYLGITGREVSGPVGVNLGRVAVLVVSVAAALISVEPSDTILELVAFAWAGFGAAFGPITLLSLYWRRLTTAGTLAGMITGAVVAFVWGRTEGTGLLELYEIVPGFLCGLVVAVVVSLLTRPSDRVEAEFDEAVALASRRI